MQDDDYKKYLSYLFDEYIRDRISNGKRYIHKMEFDKYGFEGNRKRLQKAIVFCRYIYSYCEYEDEILETFTLPAFQKNIGTIMDTHRRNNQILGKTGVIDCLEAHYSEILNGIEVDYLPAIDKEIMQECGSKNPEADLRGIIYLLKQRNPKQDVSSSNVCNYRINDRLAKIDNMIKETWQEYYDAREGRKENPPKKSRRWFKGLGNIGQGVALSLGNIGLALGAFSFPVSPETQTWGALVSATTGVGMIMNGIGELRSE